MTSPSTLCEGRLKAKNRAAPTVLPAKPEAVAEGVAAAKPPLEVLASHGLLNNKSVTLHLENHVSAVHDSKCVRACKAGAWTLATIKKTSGETNLFPYKCRSWRHTDSDCSKWKADHDFKRIEAGLKKRQGWVLLVLTLFRKNLTPEEEYKLLTPKIYSLWKWIQRNYEGEVAYIALVEEHKDGFPHVNMCIHSSGFLAAMKSNWRSCRQKLNKAAVRCGFGFRIWAEVVHSDKAIAGYFAKLVNEFTKTRQTPVGAPRHFRRLRASRGLLPPVYKNKDFTGGILQMPIVDVLGLAPEAIQRVLAKEQAKEYVINPSD